MNKTTIINGVKIINITPEKSADEIAEAATYIVDSVDKLFANKEKEKTA